MLRVVYRMLNEHSGRIEFLIFFCCAFLLFHFVSHAIFNFRWETECHSIWYMMTFSFNLKSKILCVRDKLHIVYHTVPYI
jgi:hypothetical protein